MILKANLEFSSPLTPLSRPVEKLIQHHMEHPSWTIFDVHEFHRYARGWKGIGYNYWISFGGTIYEARGHHVGAHAGAPWNGRSLGIGYQGDFMRQYMTNAQLQAGIWLNKYLADKHSLTADDTVGHRGVSSTLCPGRNFRIAELKKGVRQLSEKEHRLIFKGKILKAKTIIDNGTMYLLIGGQYIPVREIAEALGLEVKWDDDTRTAYID